MKVGVNSFIIREISGHGFSVDELPVDVIELGFDDMPVLTPSGINWEVLHELLSLNVDFTLHAPCSDGKNIKLDLGVNSRKNIRIMENVFRIAQILDAEYVVVHGGDIRNNYHRAFINTKRQLMEIATIAEEYEVKLVMENLTDNRIGAFPHELLPFLEKNVSVCLDIGHAFLTSLKYRLDIGEYFLLDDIEHVHLHDNSGARDEHRAMGEGRIDFNNILPKILFRKPKNIIWEIREYQKADNIIKSILSVKSPKIRVVR